MVFESRKWRLLLRAALLVGLGWAIIGWAGPALYALQEPEPAALTSPAQLADGALDGRFATVAARPDLPHAVAVHSESTTVYWVPLAGFDHRLLVSTPGLAWQQTDPVPRFTGKIVSLATAPDAAAFKAVLDREQPDQTWLPQKEVYVLLEGEHPGTYRPMIPVVGALALLLIVVSVDLVRVWRRWPRRGVTRLPGAL